MHLKRWITGIIALPVLFSIVYYGGETLFSILIWCAALVGIYEYISMSFKGKNGTAKSLFSILTYTSATAAIAAVHFAGTTYLLSIISVNFILSGLIGVIAYKLDDTAPELVMRQNMGLVYIPVLLSILILIRNHPNGIVWVFFILCIVALGDTSALYVGTYFGKHKLWPAASPKKTIEGALGGILGNIIVGLVFKLLLLKSLSLFYCFFFSVSVGIAGQVGDLFESILKRSAGIKDSGTILPGHGGMLDRIDALLFAVPLAYFFLGHIF